MACPVVGSGGDGPIPVGRRHPVLDCLIATSASFIGVESKRFEPFRAKRPALFSDAYGEARLRVADGESPSRQPAPQTRSDPLYLYAEPRSWPTSGKPIRNADRAGHREEIADFAGAVEGDEVGFVSRSYSTLLDGWMRRGSDRIRVHARAVQIALHAVTCAFSALLRRFALCAMWASRRQARTWHMTAGRRALHARRGPRTGG